jgi:hypothetical protein
MAIFKTWKAKNPAGKSLPFLYLVLIGYIAGCLHKIYYSWNWVFYLFAINTVMVLTDIILTHYYNHKNRKL